MNARIAIFGLMAAVMMALPGSARHRGSDVQDINEGRTIRFEHTLPAMHITTPPNGTYNNYELGYPGVLTTSDPDLGLMLWKLRTSIWADRHMVLVDGKTCSELRINGEKRHFTISEINESRYADFSAKADGLADIELIF